MHAAPVNFVDLLVVTGAYQFLPESALHARQRPGRCGLCDGPEVEHLHVGDRVLAMAEQGGYAEKVVGRRGPMLSACRTDCHSIQAAAMGVAFDTAWCALRDRARLQPGETVLVLGASGAVGIAAVQLAKAMGAKGAGRHRTHGKVRDGPARGRRCGDRSVRCQICATACAPRFTVSPMGAALMSCWIRSAAMLSMRRCVRLPGAGGSSSSASPADASLSEGQLPVAQEHRDQRPADQRLSQAQAGHDGGLATRSCSAGSRRQAGATRGRDLSIGTRRRGDGGGTRSRARGRVVLAVREA